MSLWCTVCPGCENVNDRSGEAMWLASYPMGISREDVADDRCNQVTVTDGCDWIGTQVFRAD